MTPVIELNEALIVMGVDLTVGAIFATCFWRLLFSRFDVAQALALRSAQLLSIRSYLSEDSRRLRNCCPQRTDCTVSANANGSREHSEVEESDVPETCLGHPYVNFLSRHQPIPI